MTLPPPPFFRFRPHPWHGLETALAALSPKGVDRADGDPLDICVISERPITRSEILLSARVVGGIKMAPPTLRF